MEGLACGGGRGLASIRGVTWGPMPGSIRGRGGGDVEGGGTGGAGSGGGTVGFGTEGNGGNAGGVTAGGTGLGA